MPRRATKKPDDTGVGEAIRYWRERREMTQGELEARINASGGAVSRWESGARGLTPRKLAKIAEALGVTSKDLIGANLSPTAQPLIDVPLLSWVNAGLLVDMDDVDLAEMADEMITVAANRRTLFALNVKGNSMDRVAGSGSIIVIDYEDRDLVPGACDVFRHKGKVGFKRYAEGPPRFEPYSTEPDHPTTFIDETTEVIGRLDQSIKRHR